MEDVTVDGQNVMLHSVEGDLVLFDKIPVPTIELPLETISNVPLHIPAREAYWKVALRIKHS